MTTRDGPPPASAVAANLALLREIAEGFRRVRGDESYDETGVRTIWHQGSMTTEMLSWEDREGTIVRQELVFTGLVVEYRRGHPVATGRLPIDDKRTGAGQSMSDLVEQDVVANGETLDLASHLLKNIPDRDFYAQHLLKQINDTADRLGFDKSRTLISDIDRFTKKGRPESRSQPTQKVHLDRRFSNRTLAFILLAAAGVLLGLCAGLLLW